MSATEVDHMATQRNGEDVSRGLEKIENKEMTLRQSAKAFKIPPGTLSARISLKPIITLQGSTCQDLLKYAAEYVELVKLTARFPNGAPACDLWLREKMEGYVKTDEQCETGKSTCKRRHNRDRKRKFISVTNPVLTMIREKEGSGQSRNEICESIHSSSGKSHTTVLLTIAANGTNDAVGSQYRDKQFE
ncbi:unnamed protein product [Didymodactylos carnosus]|uniref:HTH psq-type domain-containing protein n=1 Tax=Didymodactylos carnosus TaxID=1234261 RepID=A0A815F2D5_9BILA|nr:unnamed protein product [Didymodactylos carnosus]CAF1320310.1 unnamed protein product [Didymodactylos carnosus]CAF3956869.1 unnamed protein product [Didymodactylos carnosus]CAF4165430.1 unnamed protein product [Didymodactylos carnosus]